MPKPQIAWASCVILFAALAAPAARSDVPVHISFDLKSIVRQIPDDFAGLSFEISLVNQAKNGGHFFSPDNHALIQTFRSLGIRSLRVGGNTAERNDIAMPNHADINSLFTFAKAANVKVIYTLRISGNSAATDAETARYILDHYASQLTCFAIGNEPSKLFKDYSAFRQTYHHHMDAITQAAPNARFSGPGSMHKDVQWTRRFAQDFAGDPRVVLITQHEYPGKSGRFAVDPESALRGCQELLSPKISDTYQKLFDAFVPAAQSAHLSYRLEETNSFSNGGATGASDAFASALWGLDYLYWWASHGCMGINFHTGVYIGSGAAHGGMKYVVFWNSPTDYAIHPLGYALKAFTLATPGQLIAVHNDANNRINLKAYAVLSPAGNLSLTLINCETESTRSADVAIASGEYRHASVVVLTAPSIDSKSDITLGCIPIRDNADWSGTWSSLSPNPSQHLFLLHFDPASAAIVRLSAR